MTLTSLSSPVDIERMFTSAHRFAELGNRAKPNIHDITRSLENAGVQLNTFEEYLNTKVNDNNACKVYWSGVIVIRIANN